MLVVAATMLASIVASLAFAVGPARGAVTLPAGFAQSRVVGGLTNPMDMEFAPDGRLFVAEQAGKVLIAEPGGTLKTFLDISAEVDSEGERGLLAIAFDPDFSSNGYVYLNYTQKATAETPAHNRIVRFTADGDTVAADSDPLLIFRMNNQRKKAHQGGAIDFGADGKLYVSTGDNFNPDNAQNPGNLFGKMLRINTQEGAPRIPSDNPFFESASGKNKAIWALGLRNPFKFAVRPGDGAIFINDVGQTAHEEINQGVVGANYGWPIHEGFVTPPDPSLQNYRNPLHQYAHGDRPNQGCAITGGTFYDPPTPRFPDDYVGNYFFADLCNGWIKIYDPETDGLSGFATGLSSPIDLEVSEKGQLYYLTRDSAPSVRKIRFTGP